MNKLSYVEARDKIWNAYFRDEIKPFDTGFCFCGTLSPDHQWAWSNHRENYPYSLNQYGEMEKELFSFMTQNCTWERPGTVMDNLPMDAYDNPGKHIKNYEEKLFAGMLAALEVLKQIHRERGEVIPEDEPLLTKRNLQTQAI